VPAAIVAIGGGSFEETRSLDERIVELSCAARPRALFIPTASRDDQDYIDRFSEAYSTLGCTIEVLEVANSELPGAGESEKIRRADLVYVGGGNTKFMVARWREIGLDLALREHFESGKPVSGLSAGAICWFRTGNSDWPIYEGIPGVNTARLDCLGWVDLVLCPHARNEPYRLPEFRQMMRTESGTGLALDDGCAIEVQGSMFRILSVAPDRAAHVIRWQDGVLIERKLFPFQDLQPLDELGQSAL
jgi:dipeptidase E